MDQVHISKFRHRLEEHVRNNLLATYCPYGNGNDIFVAIGCEFVKHFELPIWQWQQLIRCHRCLTKGNSLGSMPVGLGPYARWPKVMKPIRAICP